MIYSLGGELFDHLHRLSLRYHGGQRVGDLGPPGAPTDSRGVREATLEVFLLVFTAGGGAGHHARDPMDAGPHRSPLLAFAFALPVPWLIRRLSPGR